MQATRTKQPRDVATAAAEKLGMEPLLNTREVAAVLGLAPGTFERHLAGGRIPKPDLIIGQRRWKRSTIAACINGEKAAA